MDSFSYHSIVFHGASSVQTARPSEPRVVARTPSLTMSQLPTPLRTDRPGSSSTLSRTPFYTPSMDGHVSHSTPLSFQIPPLRKTDRHHHQTGATSCTATDMVKGSLQYILTPQRDGEEEKRRAVERELPRWTMLSAVRPRLLSESSNASTDSHSSRVAHHSGSAHRSTRALQSESDGVGQTSGATTGTAGAEKKKRKARICTAEGCNKYVVDHGLCIRHGGGKRCYIDGCNCRAQNRGLCWKHGGFTICKVENCTKRAKSRGICWSHGGGTRCKEEFCTKIAVSLGLCWAHGGGKRCELDGCRKPASERTNNMCAEHYGKQPNTTSDAP